MRRMILAALAVALAACTVPPPAPPPARGSAARPQRARPAAPPAAAPGVAAAPAEEGQAPSGGRYRVRSDGTVGCADPQAPGLLRQLKAGEGVSPRLLAQAHRDGRCMTTFRTSRWALDSAEGEVVRLRLAGEGGPALYFLRDEVAPAGD